MGVVEVLVIVSFVVGVLIGIVVGQHPFFR